MEKYNFKLEKAIKEYEGKVNPNDKPFNPFMKNTKWTDEEGNKYSSWNIGDGLTTGDGGAEMFKNAMKEAIKKEIK